MRIKMCRNIQITIPFLRLRTLLAKTPFKDFFIVTQLDNGAM